MAGVSSPRERAIGYTLLLLCGFILRVANSQATVVQEEEAPTTNANDVDPSPFLLLGIGHQLYSLPYSWPHTPGEEILLHTSPNLLYYITGIAYHYRRRLVFWGNTGGQLYTGSFQNRTQLTNVRVEQVIHGTFFDPKEIGDIAVDWLNDNLYWTERDKGRVMELDLETGARRTVVQSTNAGTAFNGLAMYPYPSPHGGWIFWSDSQNGTIERAGVSGEDQHLVTSGLMSCVWPMEIDYAEQKVLWANICERTLLSLSIGDSDQSVTRVLINSPLSSMTSMTLFEDILLWNEGRIVKATNKSVDSGEVVTIYTVGPGREAVSVAVEVVHPKKQPAEETFLEIIRPNINMELVNETCPPCVNGQCAFPSLCICHPGWTGDNCTIDIDECASEDGGCDLECHNTAGGYYCSCNSTTMLDVDGRSCIPIEPTTTSMVFMMTTISSPLIEPKETTAGPSSSIQLSPSPSSAILLYMTSVASSSASPTPFSPSPSISSSTATQTSPAPSQVVMEPKETPTSMDSSVEPVSSGTLIIIVAAAGGSCALGVIVVVIMIIAVVHYAKKRCGSYTVNPDPSKESGVPSWVVARTGSPTSHVNGITQVNGVSHITACTSSFKTNSPTCSTHSFT